MILAALILVVIGCILGLLPKRKPKGDWDSLISSLSPEERQDAEYMRILRRMHDRMWKPKA